MVLQNKLYKLIITYKYSFNLVFFFFLFKMNFHKEALIIATLRMKTNILLHRNSTKEVNNL